MTEEPTDRPRRWMLRPLHVHGLAGEIEIPPDGLTLGRAGDNDVVVPGDPYPHVSGHHARLLLAGGTPAVEDLASRNGTFVSGEAVRRQELRGGDVVQLGHSGPRFAVVADGASLTETVPAAAPRARAGGRDGGTATPAGDLSTSRVMRIKRALGIPQEADIESMIVTRGRRNLRLAGGIAIVVLIGVVTWLLLTLEQQGRVSEDRLARLQAEMQQRIDIAERELDEQRAAWEAEKATLEADRERLAARLAEIDRRSGASAGEIATLREQLEATERQLEAYNPVNLAQRSLQRIAEVTRAVVFVETHVHFRHTESGELLHVEESPGRRELNVEGRGRLYSVEGSGSGFALGPDGHIVTNAHVVQPPAMRTSRSMGPDAPRFEPEVELAVVFNDESQRRPARLLRRVHDADDDLALLRIEPFAGMPYLPVPDLEHPPPKVGDPVFLSGYPLGKMALMAGDTVNASTFKGILSRRVGSYLQVDAAVHPGNSGGPVFDTDGRLLGIVTKVQRTPEGPYAATIGYIIPISRLLVIWPPEPSPPPGDEGR